MAHAHDGDGDVTLDETWLSDYMQRARVVAGELGTMFQNALAREVLKDIGTIRRTTPSIAYLRRRRRSFAHPVVLFIYCSRFDADLADELLGPGVAQAALQDGLTAREILERKSARLVVAFGNLVKVADTGAGHYVAAMMSPAVWSALPLVWEAPAADPAADDDSRDAKWWLIFRYLCEISRAIVAYGGYTPSMLAELRHIRGNPRLRKRLLWLDGDLNLYFPDRDEEQWPLHQLPEVLQRIEARDR